MSFNLQWTRDGVDIPGATQNTYTVQAADKGHTLFFRAVATNAGGSTPATSPGVFVPADGPALAISGNIPATGIVGQAYLSTCAATGGTPPYAFSLAGGSVPSGTTFSTSTGVISGPLTTAQVKTGIIVRVTDHKGATANLPASGSATITVAASGTSVTPATLFAAVQAAQPGAILSMQPGDYTNIDWFAINKAAPGIILQGQAGVHLAYIGVNSCSGLTFRGIATTSFRNGQYACLAADSDRIVFDSLPINGGTPGIVHTGVGIFFNTCTNSSALNNVLVQVGDGIDSAGCSNLTIKGNSVTQFSANAYFTIGCTTGLWEQNFAGNLDHVDPGTHPDFMQFSNGTNITLRNNNYDGTLSATQPQGTEVENVVGLVIDGYAGFGLFTNGVFCSQCKNVTWSNIFVQGWTYSPLIYFRDGTDNLTVAGCFSASLPFSGGIVPPEAPNTNYHIGVNTTIPNASSASDRTRYLAFLQSNPLIPVS